MANYTRKAIIQTFEDMLREMPFGKITVSALVARCEISSNTFYYHFRDIYDLLDGWLAARRDDFIKQTEHMPDWAERFKIALRQMQENPQLVYHIFDSINRERLERFIFGSVEELFYQEAQKQAAGLNLPDDTVRAISGFCCYSLLGFMLKFLWEKMAWDVDAAVDRLSDIFSGALEYVLAKAAGGQADGTVLPLSQTLPDLPQN